jgi:hypothetical protein
MFCSSFLLISYYVIFHLLFLLLFLVVGDSAIQLITHKDVDYRLNQEQNSQHTQNWSISVEVHNQLSAQSTYISAYTSILTGRFT